MICQRCGLTDPYHGQGDGLGSCDCSRCGCCQAAPYECECSQDTEWLDAEELEELNDGDDGLCNDPGCVRRMYRVERRRAEVTKGGIS